MFRAPNINAPIIGNIDELLEDFKVNKVERIIIKTNANDSKKYFGERAKKLFCDFKNLKVLSALL